LHVCVCGLSGSLLGCAGQRRREVAGVCCWVRAGLCAAPVGYTGMLKPCRAFRQRPLRLRAGVGCAMRLPASGLACLRQVSAGSAAHSSPGTRAIAALSECQHCGHCAVRSQGCRCRPTRWIPWMWAPSAGPCPCRTRRLFIWVSAGARAAGTTKMCCIYALWRCMQRLWSCLRLSGWVCSPLLLTQMAHLGR
jgi:hypothetical protein